MLVFWLFVVVASLVDVTRIVTLDSFAVDARSGDALSLSLSLSLYLSLAVLLASAVVADALFLLYVVFVLVIALPLSLLLLSKYCFFLLMLMLKMLITRSCTVTFALGLVIDALFDVSAAGFSIDVAVGFSINAVVVVFEVVKGHDQNDDGRLEVVDINRFDVKSIIPPIRHTWHAG